ncbi:hypothetical protein [Natronomonas sp. EA1]|uniref:hypothetical protein n=1 Tax=Natronomonas sp. EA1 TaxID=3421655 RepID=UPI003EBDC6DC
MKNRLPAAIHLTQLLVGFLLLAVYLVPAVVSLTDPRFGGNALIGVEFGVLLLTNGMRDVLDE